MTENEDSKVAVVGSEGVGEALKTLLTEKSDSQIVTVGSLNVDSSLEADKKESIIENKEVISLPEVGTTFNIGSDVFVVTYINEGKRRFTASPKIR